MKGIGIALYLVPNEYVKREFCRTFLEFYDCPYEASESYDI